MTDASSLSESRSVLFSADGKSASLEASTEADARRLRRLGSSFLGLRPEGGLHRPFKMDDRPTDWKAISMGPNSYVVSSRASGGKGNNPPGHHQTHTAEQGDVQKQQQSQYKPLHRGERPD